MPIILSVSINNVRHKKKLKGRLRCEKKQSFFPKIVFVVFIQVLNDVCWAWWLKILFLKILRYSFNFSMISMVGHCLNVYFTRHSIRFHSHSHFPIYEGKPSQVDYYEYAWMLIPSLTLKFSICIRSIGGLWWLYPKCVYVCVLYIIERRIISWHTHRVLKLVVFFVSHGQIVNCFRSVSSINDYKLSKKMWILFSAHSTAA